MQRKNVYNYLAFSKFSCRLILKMFSPEENPFVPVSLDRKQLPHHPYSPDLAISDFYLLGSLKEFLLGIKFSSVNEVKSTVSKG